MSAVDVTGAARRRSRTGSGLVLAVLSAASFGSAGPLAGGLLATGWSPGAVVLVRVTIAALVVAPFAAVSLRGHWNALRRNTLTVLAYGALAVAGAQFCYFSAVSRMDVGPALLIEYTAPAAVVVWLWLRHAQRPGAVTLAGAALAAVGLLLVLDLFSGADLDPVGVLWALGAMVGATTYFVLSADDTTGLPPLALAGGGLLTGAVALGLLGAVGVLPLRATTAAVTYADRTVTWWVPLLVLGVVTAGLAYTTGVLAGRRLGSRLASFVALLEVVAGVVAAWLLLGQLPATVQLLGGVLVLAGVVTVKLGEPRAA
ncbi:EamA family transporter [Kineococcus sp. R8]|uniref:EamA family transporter n=1 Tax=Kineococcus siccus TaxID=2696567 RepID=UPI001411DE7C|nr:EamA family transporter [Kineococcus siccus]NAZ80857.1 EamA family transporter [Kineococcus siccus]